MLKGSHVTVVSGQEVPKETKVLTLLFSLEFYESSHRLVAVMMSFMKDELLPTARFRHDTVKLRPCVNLVNLDIKQPRTGTTQRPEERETARGGTQRPRKSAGQPGRRDNPKTRRKTHE